MIIPPKIHHYGMKIDENRTYEYYVHSSGYVWRRNKNTGESARVAMFKHSSNKKYIVRVNYQTIFVHMLIAKTFLAKYYKENYDIVFQDGDMYNCDVNNLAFEKRATIRRTQGQNRKKIVVEDSERIRIFDSVRATVRWFKTSHQLVGMVASGKIKDSGILKGYKVYYLEGNNEKVKRIIARGMRKDL